MYQPQFKYNHSLIGLLGSIDAARGAVSERVVEENWEKATRFSARCHSISDTLRLEGLNTPYLSVKRILEGESSPKDSEFLQDILNFNQALSYIEILSDSSQNVSETLIKEISRMCLQNIARTDKYRGSYRIIQNWVVNSDENEIIYTPPSPENLKSLMESFVKWLADNITGEIHPVLTAGIIHHWFLAINPFVIANTRIACLLSRLVLLKNGYNIKRWGWFEGYFARDIPKYYESLYSNYSFSASEINKLTEWLEYYCLAVKSSCEYTLQSSAEFRITTKAAAVNSAVQKHKKVQPHHPSLNERQRRILKLAEKYERFHRRDIQAEIDITQRYNPKTISRDLKTLVDMGLLLQGGERKGIFYSLNK